MIDRTPDELRTRLRRLRADLSPEDQRRRGAAASSLIVTLPVWQSVRRVALTRPVGGELDLTTLWTAAVASGIEVVLPVLDGEALRFARWDETTSWESNRFGIPEPSGVPTLAVDELDLVILPAVAIDLRGTRLGMGGGFYDRTLAGVRSQHPPERPLLIGAIHDEQLVDRIEARPWDVPVDLVVTPSRSFEVPTS